MKTDQRKKKSLLSGWSAAQIHFKNFHRSLFCCRAPWLDGRYDSAKQEVTWQESSTVVEASMWGTDQPDTKSGTMLCVYIRKEEQLLALDECSFLDRVICELRFN